MNLLKILDWVTPLMLLALAGVIMILTGIVQPAPENNALQFIFGVPLAAGAAGLHFLVRYTVHRNVLRMWVIESILVAAMCYVFLNS